MISTPQNRRAESGNAFYIILIGIFLFAALMFVFSRSVRQGSGNLSAKEAQLAADDMLSFVQQLQRGVDRVSSNNCSENDLNFDQTFDSGYTNATAPADRHCNIFDMAGAGIAYRTPPEHANDGSPWIFNGSNNVAASTFGTVAPDLMVVVNNVAANVCNQINSDLRIAGATVETGTPAFDKFMGTYAAAGVMGSGDGQRAECITLGGVHRFYSVLLER